MQKLISYFAGMSSLANPSNDRFTDLPSNAAGTGWLASIAWLAGLAGSPFLIGTTIQGLLVINNPDYIARAWQGYLFMTLIISIALIVNTYFARLLPRLEAVMLALFTCAFVAFLAIFWTSSPKLTAGRLIYRALN